MIAWTSCPSTSEPLTTLRPRGVFRKFTLPPRGLRPRLKKAGFSPGWSLDLTVTDDQGQPWDFSKHECREKARQLLHKTKPLLLVGSPMCTWFSLLQNLNKKHMSPEDWNKGYRRAVEHIKFVFEIYDIQMRSGRYFLHEHPATATSWKLPVVTDFCAKIPALVRDHNGYVPIRHDDPGRKGRADTRKETDSLAD